MPRSPRTAHQSTATTGRARVALGVSALLVAGVFSTVSSAPAAQAEPGVAHVDLGSAEAFSVLAGGGVTNTGTSTVLALDLGLSPVGAIVGFPPGKVDGAVHDKDVVAEVAQEDRQAAYDAVVALPSTAAFAGDQAGAVFKPGVHTSAAAVTNTGTITLDADGDSNAVFVFQVGAALSSAAASKVVLTDGALAGNVYWQVAGAVSLGAGAKWAGTILAAGVVAFGEGASLKGRILTPGTATLANSPITQPKDDLIAPVVSINGGATSTTNDTSPTISGLSDEPVGRAVMVSIAGQTLATTVTASGTWRVSATDLVEGDYSLVATITDASRNVGTATQVLTVDLTAPSMSLDGGGRHSTNDTTPTISGTTDATSGTVSVKVDGQLLLAPVADGTWGVDALALIEDAHVVVATVSDGSGNTSTATQALIVDLTAPVVAIDGGAKRSTVDTSPWVYGTSGERAGTSVQVTVHTQTLAAVVRTGGTWSVSATDLPAGAHAVVATITDAAGNTASASQALTIGTDPADPTDPREPVDPGDPTGPAPVDPPPVQPTATYQPDATIRGAGVKVVGAQAYGSAQRATQQLRTRPSAKFRVQLINRGNTSERLAVKGARRNAKFNVVYLVGGKNVTAKVVAGTYRTAVLRPGQVLNLVVKVTRTTAARNGDTRTFTVRAASTHTASRTDTVKAVVHR